MGKCMNALVLTVFSKTKTTSVKLFLLPPRLFNLQVFFVSLKQGLALYYGIQYPADTNYCNFKSSDYHSTNINNFQINTNKYCYIIIWHHLIIYFKII